MAPALPVEFTGQKASKRVLSKKNWFSRKNMGKSRKVTKGYTNGNGFVSDYRHAVETMADSEGYVDTEISEDSCGMGRKFGNGNANANVESFQQYGGVPLQVISLSKLTSFERKEIGLRLKGELEQVRLFWKNHENALSPSSDVHSCNAGQRKPVPLPVSQSKKRGPVGRNGNGGLNSKKAVLPPPSTGNAMLMKQCETLLKNVLAQELSWVFSAPVDIVKLNIPDYYTVIKHPMDLGTVKTKLNSGKYADPWGFAADVRLTFSNAMTYNPRGNEVHVLAEKFSKFFETRWKSIEKKLSVPMRPNVQQTRTEIETETIPMPPLKKKKTSPFRNEIKQIQEPVKRTMSIPEKQKLSAELEASLADLPERIIYFLKEISSNGNATEDEIEIDIDALSDDTLFKLRKLLDDFLVEKQKKTEKAETCEIELHNDSGFSNSSMQAGKVNDVNEEDVDIGGNDVPILSFPPVEIEKDTAGRDSKYSSSSSSSSDSGSSSDSDSSSGSESDGEKLPALENNIKDTMGSEVNLEQTTAVPIDMEVCVNGVSQVEQKPECVPVCSEVNERQEGESAPSERQVSPDKLYRRAILKRRFADTILNAQVKTNGKVEKQDIERSRLEKAELEKRRKEEKARLQAEAKAAEGLRNAELEAAAAAKRKREVEREAARQAIQKMEKMVDINDNSQFLEDLEMLNVAPAEPLQSFIDETSEHCQDPLLGSFNFQGKGNALEQLGLYMKNDDEDEEDVEPQGSPVKRNDPEEGEID